jgi:hypothetical protein
MKRVILVLPAFLALAACVSITPRASRIQVLRSDTTLVQGCKRLGRISAEASAMTKMDYNQVDQQAVNNMRDAAAAKWGDQVDTVVVSNVDRFMTKSLANGVAFSCDSGNAS